MSNIDRLLYSDDHANIALAIEIIYGNRNMYNHYISMITDYAKIVHMKFNSKDDAIELVANSTLHMYGDLCQYEKLHRFKNIKEIHIKYSEIKKLPSWLPKFDNIESITIGDTNIKKFTSKDLNIISKLKNLNHISANNISDIRFGKHMKNLGFTGGMSMYSKKDSNYYKCVKIHTNSRYGKY